MYLDHCMDKYVTFSYRKHYFLTHTEYTILERKKKGFFIIYFKLNCIFNYLC